MNGLLALLPMIITTGMTLLIQLANGLVKALPKLTAMLPTVILTITSGLISHLPEIIDAGFKILLALANGLLDALPQLLDMLPQIISGIKDGFTSVDWLGIGKNIISGIGKGIKRFASDAVDAAKNVAGKIGDTVKNLFGIHSPSRLMAFYGRMIDMGLARGISRYGVQPVRAATGMAGSVGDGVREALGSASMPVTVGLAAGGTAGAGIILNYNQYSEAGLSGEQQLTEAAQRAKAILLGL